MGSIAPTMQGATLSASSYERRSAIPGRRLPVADQMRQIPLTRPPFPLQEYRRRQEAVSARVTEAALDGILITANTHQQYVGGYHGGGSYFRPFPIVLVPGRLPTYVVRQYDEDAVRAQSVIDEIIPYVQQKDFVPVLAGVLRSLGIASGRLGLELDAWNLAPADVLGLQAELPRLRIVDATSMVARVAAIKSPLEIQSMRKSMALTDLAVRTFQTSIAEGCTEIQVSRAIDEAVAAAGGSMCRDQHTLVFGVRTALPHGAPKDYPLERDQPAFTELGGLANGYAAGLCRSAVLGRHPGAEALHAMAEEALEAAISKIRPGAIARDVDAAARAVFERAAKANVFRHRTGYQTGISWSDRGNLSLDPDTTDVIEENMTLHLPIIVFQKGEYAVGTSENVLVTPTEVEILSSTPHTLFRRD